MGAPKFKFPATADRPVTGKARRIASLSAAAAVVVGIGAASALFVDYLADRALARGADVALKPVVAKAVETSAETKVAALAPAPARSQPSNEPVAPPKAEIAVATPDPAAVAKIAVGPEHAIELPTDDPTASPVIHTEQISTSGDLASVDENVANEESLVADVDADGTQTAAIDPAEPVIDEQPVKKPKRQKAVQAPAGQAKPQQAARETEVASLPGVDIGGLAGNPSGDDNAASTVQTITKQTKNLGGVVPGAARVTSAVKLRSGPDKGSGVLGVVPAGSSVNVLSCNGWCQIAYDGRTGWVYKNFLATASNAKPQQKQPAAKAASAAAPPTADPAAQAQRKAQSSRL